MSACNPNKIDMYIDTIFLFNVFLFVVVVFTVLITCFHWDPLLTRLCSGYKPKSYKEKKKNTNAENQHERLSYSYYGGKFKLFVCHSVRSFAESLCSFIFYISTD